MQKYYFKLLMVRKMLVILVSLLIHTYLTSGIFINRTQDGDFCGDKLCIKGICTSRMESPIQKCLLPEDIEFGLHMLIITQRIILPVTYAYRYNCYSHRWVEMAIDQKILKLSASENIGS